MVNIDDLHLSKNAARQELTLILLFGCLVLFVSSYFRLYEIIFSYVEFHELWQLGVLFILSLYFAVTFTFFSFRRWQEARTEINKRIELEKDILLAAHTADHANRAKSEFLANMSHEIRTPLNSIIGFSDLLMEEMYGNLNDKQTRFVSNISSSGKHLLELINQILDISKIESGQMKLNQEKFNISDTLEEIKTILYPLASKKRIKLTFVSNNELAEIIADKLKIKQIIFNLASNAIKFTPEGGRVDIATAMSDKVLTVMIADTGIGIRKSELETIFEPFEQAGQMCNKENQGTGLGLSIAKKFVELHKGRIWVQSQPGIGSTFIFKIPDEIFA
ncbi:sensor histidine kinase [Methanolobus halotolerans]|uniref:histidine kinase n=1 Tax=Methanolobus halotolerans TaxID=2052935 RepID=A0A4E0PXP8_9EURY|nr:HAMP domain-containing sensor histidine kinase [Methanolobus halotolerans]TGC09503.1 hypothetical protein CUN85_06645 [Methanolobus halotolerans]